MEQTSRLSIIVNPNNSEAIIRRLERSLFDLQRQGENTANSLANLGRQGSLNGLLSGVARASGGITNLGSSVSRTTGIFNNYYNTLNRTTNNFNQFNNIINRTNNNITRMGDTINRNITVINNYNRSLSGTHDALSRLQGLLTGGMFGTMGLSALKTADVMQSLDSQVKLVTKSEEEYLAVREKVRVIADQNYADIEATTNLYQNSARALANLGKTQQEVLIFTNAISLAMRTGGKSALEQKSALYQLGQAMQSGVLNGDEFRSISENAPILLDLIAQKLKITRGEVREMSKEGKITAELIYDVMANATSKLEEMAKKMPITMGQGMTLVKNKYKQFVGDFLNNTSGISGKIASTLQSVALNFDGLFKVTLAGGAVMLANVAIQANILSKAFLAVNMAMSANPAVLLVGGFVALGTAVGGFTQNLDTMAKVLTAGAVVALAKYTTTTLMASPAVTALAGAVSSFNLATLSASASQVRYNALMGGVLLATRAVTAVQSVGAGVVSAYTRALSVLGTTHGLLTGSISRTTAAQTIFNRTITTPALLAWTKAKQGAIIATNTLTVGTSVLTGAVARFGALLNAHPLMTLATVIFACVASTEGLQGAMDSLGDTVSVVGSIFSEFVTVSSHGLKEILGGAIDFFANKFVKGSKDSTKLSETVFKTFFDGTEKGFLGIIQVVARIFDMAGASIASFVKLGIHSLENLGIGAINAVEKVKEFFGGEANYQKYYETNLYAIMEEVAPKIFKNGLEAFVNRHVSSVKTKKTAESNLAQPSLNIPMSEYQKPKNKDDDKDKKSKKEKDSKQLITGELAEAIFWLSHKYKLNPNDVAAVISFETNRTFSTNARNSGTSGTGLFQLMQYSDGTDHGGNAKKWDYYGLSRDQFGALSPMEQMHYFDKFFQSKKLRQGASLGEIYDAVAGYGYRKGTKAYNKNKVWDANKDGIIRKGEAVTAKAFQQHRKNYFPNGIDLQAVGRAQADDAKIGVQNNKEQQKILDNQKNLLEKLFKLYESKVDIRRLDLKKELEDIDSSTLLSDDVKTRYKRIAQDRHKVQNALEKKRIKLEANQHKMSSLEILKDKKEIAKMEIVLRPNLTDKEYQYLLENSDEYYDKLINLEQKKSDFSMQKIDFELKKYNMSIPDKLEAEKDLAIQELDLREGLTDEILKLEKQAVESRYRFDLKQFQKSQQEKIDSFRNTIQANTPALTKLTDILNKNYMSKTGYEILQLDKSILAKKAEEIKRYDNLVKSINAQDDTGNYVINDVVERYRLLQEAEQAHQKELTAIVENGKLERQELDKNHAEYQMGLYKQGLDLFGSVWNTATDIVKKSLGEQSTAAKIMFGTQKAISIAQAILNTEQAYTKALAEGGAIMGIPMATMVRGLGYTSIGLMTSQAIAGFKTGGYTGNVGTSTVAGVVHGQEYVVNAQATKRIGVDNLNKLNSGGSIGGNVNNISVNVTVNSDGSADVKTNHQIGKELGQAIVVAVQNELRKEDRQGGRFYGRR